jgi:hypothetical protein
MGTPSPLLDELNRAIKRYGQRLSAATLVGSLSSGTTSARDVQNLKSTVTTLRREMESTPEQQTFLNVFGSIVTDELLAYLEAMDNFKKVLNKKWEANNRFSIVNLLRKWNNLKTDVCGSTGSTIKIFSEFNADPSAGPSAQDVSSALDDLAKLGFDMPNLRDVLNSPQLGYCDAIVHNEKKWKNNAYVYEFTGFKTDKNRWENYIGYHAQQGMSSATPATIQEEVGPALKFFTLLKSTSPMQLLAIMNQPASDTNQRPIVDIIRDIFQQERALDGKLPENLGGLADALSERRVLDLVQASASQEIAQFVADGAGRLAKAVASGISQPNKSTKAVLEDLDNLTGKLLDATSRLTAPSSIQDAIKAMKDVHAKMISVVQTMTRLGYQASGVSGFSSSSGNSAALLQGEITSMWSSALQPGNFSRFQAEMKPQTARLRMYRDMLRQHHAKCQADTVTRDVGIAKENTSKLLTELIASAGANRYAIKDPMVEMLKNYVRTVKRIVARFERRHSEFILWSNRRALDYVLKWASHSDSLVEAASANKPQVDVKNEIAKVMSSSQQHDGQHQNHQGQLQNPVGNDDAAFIKEYLDLMRTVASDADKKMMEVESTALGLFTTGSYLNVLNEEETLLETVQASIDDLEKYLVNVRIRVARLYSIDGYSIADVLRDSTFLVVYMLKAVRVFLLWAALVFAKSIFMPFYTQAVYVRNEKPPHPAYFVLAFLLTDVALNLGVYALLRMLHYVFRSPDNNFPIDDTTMRAFMIDYGISTTLIVVLSLTIAAVIRRKKYFRYRFEGDRGIRAMSTMIWGLSSVILIIPYFRFAD